MRRDLPEILYGTNSNYLVYCERLRYKRTRTCLALTRELKLYEFHEKRLLQYADLNRSCLREVSARIQNYNGPKTKRANCDGTLQTPNASFMFANGGELNFGKYVYRNHQIYILLHCWHKLLVLRRPMVCVSGVEQNASYSIVAEYADVASFRLINDRQKYQALVEIEHTNGTKECTDFQNDRHQNGIASNYIEDKNKVTRLTDVTPAPHLRSSSNFKQLLQRVTNARSELLLHRAMTQREFMRMCEMQTFGPALARSPLVEEKQLLTRCGDIWLRYGSTQDALIIGVPLLNNAGACAHTIVRKLRPMLQTTATEVSDGSDDNKERVLAGFSYRQRLYQLRSRIKNPQNIVAEDLSQFFDSQNEMLQANSWHASDGSDACADIGLLEQQLLPESSGVLLIELQLAELITYKHADLFLCYDLLQPIILAAADTTDNAKSTTCIPQQLYLRRLNIDELIRERHNHTITFDAANSLHQDLLSVVMATHDSNCCLHITYSNADALAQFTELLGARFQFDVYECKNNDGDTATNDSDDLDAVAASYTAAENAAQPPVAYYNRQANTQWHGMLLFRSTIDTFASRYSWRIYASSMCKLRLFMRTLMQDLLQHECNVVDVQFQDNSQVEVAANVMRLEHALRQELNVWRALIEASNQGQSLAQTMTLRMTLNKLQRTSDWIVSVIAPLSEMS